MSALAKDKTDVFGEFPARYNEWEQLAKANYEHRVEKVDYREVKLWQAVCEEWPRHKKAVEDSYGNK